MDDKEFLENLLQRYRNNEISDKELEVFFYLLKQGELDEVLNRQLEADKDDIINGNMREKPESGFFSHSRKGFLLITSILVTVVMGWLIYTYRANIYHLIFGNDVATLKTAKGQRTKLKFGDGSVVWLNEGSTLLYPEGTRDDHIDVELVEGEAYFYTADRKISNFFVLTKGINARLSAGSALNIRSYKYQGTTEFTAIRGKVTLVHEKAFDIRGTELSENERASVDKISGAFIKTKTVGANAMAWKDGFLVFDQEPFVTVAATLENRFDVKIVFESESIKETKVSGKFLRSDPFADILEVMAKTHNLHYMLDQQTVILKAK